MKTILWAAGICAMMLTTSMSHPPGMRRELPGIGTITLLNAGKTSVDWKCLEDRARSLVEAVDGNRIEDFKTLIDRDHTIVKDFLKEKGMRIERKGGHENLIVPFRHRGERFVLYQGDDYRLVGLAGDRTIEFIPCFGK